MSNSDKYCILSNPDISGIGVRTAIYAQNLLSFGPAIYALQDRKVTSTELESLEAQSTTILITAFAILLSTVVQALTLGLTNFHATIILNLSWMNNTNMVIYFLLYAHNKAEGDHPDLGGGDAGELTGQKFWSRWVTRGKEAIREQVLIIGSIHLSVMAAVGIWVWSRPVAFGGSQPCSLSASVVLLGQSVPLASKGLQSWSILIYTLLLLPVINLIIPIAFFVFPYLAYKHASGIRHPKPTTLIILGLLVLIGTDTILLVDTEIAIQRNKHLQQPGDSAWTFGQTLALLLLLVPLRDLVEVFMKRRQKKYDDLRRDEATITLKDEMNSDRVVRIMRESIQRGAELDPKDSIYIAALQDESGKGRLDVVTFLVEHHVDPDGQDGMPLIDASDGGHLDIVQFLVEGGANVNCRGADNRTALKSASNRGHLDIVKFLANRGAHVTVGALMDASGGGHLGVVNFLVERDADVDIQKLIDASSQGHLDVVKHLIEEGIDVNTAALKRASDEGNLNVMNFLVERRAHFVSKALVGASGGGHLDIVKFVMLKVRGVQDRIANLILDQFALVVASGGGHLDVVEFLVKSGADVNAKDEQGLAALDVASNGSHLDVVKFLVKSGAGVKDTALVGASGAGHLDVVEFLVNSGANVENTKALKDALDNGQLDVVKFLVKEGANIDIKDYFDGIAFVSASAAGRLDVVEFLVKSGFPVERGEHVEGRISGTALVGASLGGHLDVVKFLVKSGADVNVKRGEINGAALVGASRGGHLDVVKFLIKEGADVNNVTALTVAFNHKHPGVVQYLYMLAPGSRT